MRSTASHRPHRYYTRRRLSRRAAPSITASASNTDNGYELTADGASCGIEARGATGATGVTGATGPAGPASATGTHGTTGTTGKISGS